MVRFSDKIAYLHHDMDDAQRAGIITEDNIPVTLRMLLGYTTRERLNTFVHDIIENSLGRDSIQMSPEIQEGLTELRALMFRNVYTNYEAKREETKAINMLKQLFISTYTEHPEAMSREYRDLPAKGRIQGADGLRLYFRYDGPVLHGEIQGIIYTPVMGGILKGRGEG